LFLNQLLLNDLFLNRLKLQGQGLTFTHSLPLDAQIHNLIENMLKVRLANGWNG